MKVKIYIKMESSRIQVMYQIQVLIPEDTKTVDLISKAKINGSTIANDIRCVIAAGIDHPDIETKMTFLRMKFLVLLNDVDSIEILIRTFVRTALRKSKMSMKIAWGIVAYVLHVIEIPLNEMMYLVGCGYLDFLLDPSMPIESKAELLESGSSPLLNIHLYDNTIAHFVKENKSSFVDKTIREYTYVSIDEECSICMESMTNKPTVCMPCNHYFCYKCYSSHEAAEFIANKRCTVRCPLCRKAVN
jgi:hypothetical protein